MTCFAIFTNYFSCTAPARNVINTTSTSDVVLTLDRAIDNCTVIDYVVNTSTNCGVCDNSHAQTENVVTCMNAQVGSECTVNIGTRLCGIIVNDSNYTFIISNTLSTTASITTSTAPSGKQECTIIIIG